MLISFPAQKLFSIAVLKLFWPAPFRYHRLPLASTQDVCFSSLPYICILTFPRVLLFSPEEARARFRQKFGNWLLGHTVSHPKQQPPSETNGFKTRCTNLLYCAYGKVQSGTCSRRWVLRLVMMTDVWV